MQIDNFKDDSFGNKAIYSNSTFLLKQNFCISIEENDLMIQNYFWLPFSVKNKKIC